jgi:hypothetical protein
VKRDATPALQPSLPTSYSLLERASHDIRNLVGNTLYRALSAVSQSSSKERFCGVFRACCPCAATRALRSRREETSVAFQGLALDVGAGRFSWRRHRVALGEPGDVVGALALHEGRHFAFDILHLALMLVCLFVLRPTIGMLLRSIVIESELPVPKCTQRLAVHCATRGDVLSAVVSSALFQDTPQTSDRASAEEREIVLDVLLSNVHSPAHNRRLGVR